MLSGPPLPELRAATIGAALRAAAADTARADRAGLVFVGLDESETYFSWAEILVRAERAAAVLRARGLRPGERVALGLPTGPPFCDALFGALLLGAVPVPLYPPVRLGRLDEYLQATGRMLAVCGARLLVSDARLLRLLGRAVAIAAPPLGCLDAAQLQSPATVAPAPTDLATDLRPDLADPEVAADALALIQFSSGSTVAPKPVALSHRSLLAQCAALAAAAALEAFVDARDAGDRASRWLFTLVLSVALASEVMA